MPGSGYSSTCLAPAPLWAEIRAKRSPGTQGGDPWAFGVEGGTSLLEQPVQCGRVSASSLGAAFLKAGNSLAWGAQPSLPLQMPRVSAASHPSTFENFQVASSLVKKIIKSHCVCFNTANATCWGIPFCVLQFCSAIAFLGWTLLLFR